MALFPEVAKRLIGCFCYIIFLSVALNGQNFNAAPVIFSEPLSPRIANYDIAVQLDAEKKTLTGKQILTWKNTTSLETRELQLHLYLNAFRNNQSTFMLESGGRLRGFEIDKDGWGYINLNKCHLLPGNGNSYQQNARLINGSANIPGQDLTGAIRFIHPDTPEHIHDKSTISIALPRAIQPGETVSLYFDFSAKLPEPPFARTGAKKEFFFVAQWFPKIGVLTEEGWNCHQFHANSEFFADFGVYNVWMTVPDKNVLGATGLRVGEPQNNGDGTATHYYHAEDVHDFAWTTSPEYLEFSGRSQDVDIRVLMQPDHRAQGPRHVEAAKKSIEYFQNWYGDYPYPNLTVVDPRTGARGAGGMEYPTLITAGTFYGLPEGLRAVELVILHEFGHNYWYHLLASNEFEESWLDEGINSYTEAQIMKDWFGPEGDAVDVFGIKVNDIQIRRNSFLAGSNLDPLIRNTWEYYSRGSYAINSYSRPAIVLSSLQNFLGEDRMRQAMRAYVERFRFKHPTSKDFVGVLEEVAGEDLDWFFDQVLYSNAVLDYKLSHISSKRVPAKRGVDFEDAANDSTMYHSIVKIRRLGEFKAPVEIQLVFDNDEVIVEKWDGQELWKKLEYVKATRLVSATVDPENKWLMDVNFTNNSAAISPSRLGINKLSLRWMFWNQFSMDQIDLVANLISFLML